MDQDYYEDADMPVNQEPEPREESNEPTTVIPLSFFEASGKAAEPGAVFTVRVVAAHDDSAEVIFESSEESAEEGRMPSEMPMMEGGGMGQYME